MSWWGKHSIIIICCGIHAVPKGGCTARLSRTLGYRPRASRPFPVSYKKALVKVPCSLRILSPSPSTQDDPDPLDSFNLLGNRRRSCEKPGSSSPRRRAY